MKISKETFVSYKKTFWDTLQNKESEIEKKKSRRPLFLKKNNSYKKIVGDVLQNKEWDMGNLWSFL